MGVGCDGRCVAKARQRETAGDMPDDEVAWSWPPDAEVKLADVLGASRAMGANKPGPQGERV